MIRIWLAAALTAAALLTSCTSYRVAKPPQLGEVVHVVVVTNDTRLVRSQAYLQAAVAHALQERLGWKVSPTGSARLELTMEEERITSVGNDRRDIPARWSITMRGHTLLKSRRGAFVSDYVGTAHASGLHEEPAALQRAADYSAAHIAAWIESIGREW